jgi:hypothetical protein
MTELFQSNSNPSALYNFSDVQSGTGMIVYYLGTIAGNYIMSNYPFYSDNEYTSYSSVSAGTYFDKDFDVTMNRATALRGIAIVNIPIKTSDDLTLKLRATLYKVKTDGVTEEQIAVGDGSTITTATPFEKVLGALLDIANITINAGEKIRLNIQIIVTALTATTLTIHHDPMDMNVLSLSLITSSSIVQLPVKVDV